MDPPVARTVTNGLESGLVDAETLPRRAYVTFLAGDGDYWKDMLADVPMDHRRKLLAQGCIIREIEPLYPPEYHIPFGIRYGLLCCWLLQAPYLGDGNFYVVMDCFFEPNWRNSPQYQIGYCQQHPKGVQWLEQLGSKPTLYFNAGMFVFEPNMATYYDILELVKTTLPTLFGEQDFLNMFFKDIYKPIPTEYNLILAMLWHHPENFELKKVKVVHYCADGSKPWRFTRKDKNMDREDVKMLLDKWWDIYNDESLDFWRICEHSTNTVACSG
ncbi:hypothetical protein R6Q57_021687 [Mikania cordata]